jgi:hypothetical protein
MATTETIKEFDFVELTRPTEDAPAGALAGVLELLDDGFAMIEVLEPELGPAARIDFVPVHDLRLTADRRRNGAAATS